MKLSVQVIVHPDDDTGDVPTARDVFTLDRDDLSADTLGRSPVAEPNSSERESQSDYQGVAKASDRRS